MTHSLCRKYICLLIIHCHVNHVTMYNLRLHSFLHINAERQVNVTKTLNDNVNSITPNVFVKLLFKQIPVTEKIILNAKGSESLRTHYFFT